jgi:short-subunit dehydrogenase
MARHIKKTALITGASGGLGFEFAKLLASDCINIVLVARNEARLKAVTLKLESICPTTITAVVQDLAKPGAPDEILADLDRQNISVDILINNAGFGGFGAFIEREWKDEAEMIAVNITALTQMTKLFVKGMVERKSGRILNVASTAAFQPGPLQAVYSASKAYVLSLSESLANELKGSGVTVTALCPGPTATGFAKAAGLERSRLFKYIKPATAREVARYGYDAMMRGKPVAVPGVLNKLGVFGTRLGPRTLLAAIMCWLHEPAGSATSK